MNGIKDCRSCASETRPSIRSPSKEGRKCDWKPQVPTQEGASCTGRALAARSLQVPAAANGLESSRAAETMMPLGSAEVGPGASGLGMERAKLLCRAEDWEEDVKEEVRERPMRWPKARHSLGWVASAKPCRVGGSREHSGICLSFYLLCQFKLADPHAHVMPLR